MCGHTIGLNVMEALLQDGWDLLGRVGGHQVLEGHSKLSAGFLFLYVNVDSIKVECEIFVGVKFDCTLACRVYSVKFLWDNFFCGFAPFPY